MVRARRMPTGLVRSCSAEPNQGASAPVGQVEGLLDAVAVVDVDVHIQHPAAIHAQNNQVLVHAGNDQ